MDINELKVQIFDIIRQQEILAAQNNQFEQVKRSLVAKLAELEKTQQEEENDENIHTED